MSDKSTIKIKCETTDLAEALLQVFIMSKPQLEHHLTSLLERKGLKSDTRLTINENLVEVTCSTPERNLVLESQGIGMQVVPYDELSFDAKYIYVEGGVVKIMVKREDRIDVAIGHFETLEEAVTNMNSNDIVDAHTNLTKPKMTLSDGTEESAASTDEDGHTPAVV